MQGAEAPHPPSPETGNASEAPPSATEFRQACDVAVARILPLVVGLLAAFYVVVAFSHPFVVPAPAALPLAVGAGLSALALGVVWLALRRREVPLRLAQPVMALLVLLALANSALHLGLVPEPRQTTNFLILMAGAGFVLLSRPWLLALLGLSLASWGVLATTAPPDPDWIHLAYAMASVAALSVAVHEMRLRNTWRLLELVHVAERRAAELGVRRQVEAELRGRELRLARFNAILLKLAKSEAIAQGDLEAALRAITEAAAEALQVARVGVFFYEASRTRLVSADVYDAATGRHERGLELATQDTPRYFAALEESRSLVAHDVLADSRTNEFRDGYLVPLGITSMIDAAIHLRGRTVGVVCHEHVGVQRRWTPEEAAFAGSVADFIAVALEARERSRQEDERRQLERRMQEAQRLESLGVLAGGIAHDFNNLLTAILGSTELALLELPAESGARPAVERIRRAGQRAAELTDQMLAYSGRSHVDVKPIDLSRIVEDMSNLLESAIRKNARLRCELDPELPAVQGDATQLGQIVMNLITNASDALGDAGGEIRLRTGTQRLTAADLQVCELRDAEPGNYVFVEVSDTGAGMDAQTRSRIFDPFFTTKTSGRGLGLAAALGIVAAHGGTIRLDTAPGRGTSFRVLIPCSLEDRPHEAPAEDATPTWRGRGTVLVVDDEEDVVQVAAEILRRAGLEVLEAHGGRQALELFRAHADRVRAALLDLTMPDLDGAEVARRLREAAPDLRIILSSGYDRNGARPGVAVGEPAGFVHKPYTAAELLGAVRVALESGGTE